MTCHPSRIKPSAAFTPMKPAPPVITTVLVAKACSCHSRVQHIHLTRQRNGRGISTPPYSFTTNEVLASAAATRSATASPTTAGTSTTTTGTAATTGTPTAIGATLAAAFAIEVRLRAGLVSPLMSALEGNCWFGASASTAVAAFRSRFASAHLGALFLQDGLARQLDTVAVNRQHLHQHLVAFFQLIANIIDAMFGNFTDVQQAIGTGDDLDKCAEIRQPRDFAEIGLPYFGSRSDVADHLQGLCRRSLIAGRNVDLAAVLY